MSIYCDVCFTSKCADGLIMVDQDRTISGRRISLYNILCFSALLDI